MGGKDLLPLAYVMSIYLFLFLLFTTVVLTTTTTTNHRRLSAIDPLPPAPPPLTLPQLPLSALPISTHSPPPPPPPPPPPEYIQQQQLKNIIDALIGAGDFATWANILFNPNTNSSIPTTTTAALIPTTATMFVPGNDALTRLSATATGAYNFDPFIIPYHILPQRLTFSELQLFRTQTRLPTLLPSKTLIITNNTAANFTIDDSLIVQPDIYLTAAVCVHGIATILDYTAYGDADSTPPSDYLPPPVADETLTPPPEFVRNSCSSICVVSGVDLLVLLLIVFGCVSIQLVETVFNFV